MTDHNYPNEIASCHTMLKKRDEIIKNLQGQSETSCYNELDILKKKYEIVIDSNLVRDGIIEDLKKQKEELELGANLKYENRIEELEENMRSMDQGNTDLMEENQSLKVKLNQKISSHESNKDGIIIHGLKEKIALLEEKLAICDKHYNELKEGLKELLENGPRKKKE